MPQCVPHLARDVAYLTISLLTSIWLITVGLLLIVGLLSLRFEISMTTSLALGIVFEIVGVMMWPASVFVMCLTTRRDDWLEEAQEQNRIAQSEGG